MKKQFHKIMASIVKLLLTLILLLNHDKNLFNFESQKSTDKLYHDSRVIFSTSLFGYTLTSAQFSMFDLDSTMTNDAESVENSLNSQSIQNQSHFEVVS